MNKQQLIAIGVPPDATSIGLATRGLLAALADGNGISSVQARIRAVLADPAHALEDPYFHDLASHLVAPGTFVPRETPAPWRQWGADLEGSAVSQMRDATRLPVAVAGALMPDAHCGYGLPIGGVLATDGAVVPYAVGVDIACRMRLSVLDLPATMPDDFAGAAHLRSALMRETVFGVGAECRSPHAHPVMDEDWSVSPVTAEFKARAHRQLGTSGSGNHFVEFGTLHVLDASLGLAPGAYLALLSHSGSRGTGAAVCSHYSKLARTLHADLPDDLARLAWLDMDHDSGREYWAAMELMGRYAAANHACIHEAIVRNLRTRVLLSVENHHNFAWKEHHFGRDVIVHRKGATPAAAGVLGVIPGSMATPGYVVRGRGQPESMDSASHGAGRVMSRTKAISTLNWADANRFLKSRNVELLSAGIDEVPFVYKDIDGVMAAQSDLVETLARFDPRMVRMAPSGERPED